MILHIILPRCGHCGKVKPIDVEIVGMVMHLFGFGAVYRFTGFGVDQLTGSAYIFCDGVFMAFRPVSNLVDRDGGIVFGLFLWHG